MLGGAVQGSGVGAGETSNGGDGEDNALLVGGGQGLESNAGELDGVVDVDVDLRVALSLLVVPEVGPGLYVISGSVRTVCCLPVLGETNRLEDARTGDPDVGDLAELLLSGVGEGLEVGPLGHIANGEGDGSLALDRVEPGLGLGGELQVADQDLRAQVNRLLDELKADAWANAVSVSRIGVGSGEGLPEPAPVTTTTLSLMGKSPTTMMKGI